MQKMIEKRARAAPIAMAIALAWFASAAAIASTPVKFVDVLPSQQAGLSWAASARFDAPLLDVAAVRAREEQPKLGRPMSYGVVQPMDRHLVEQGIPQSGNWTPLADGRLALRMEVSSRDAVSLDIAFDRIDLPESAELYLSSADGTFVLGPIRASDRSDDGRIYSPLINGSLARVELIVDAAERDSVSLSLRSVTHGYRGLFGLENQPGILSGSCNVDVACPLGNSWGDQIDSVGQYVFQRDGLSYVCSGSLIANTSNARVPYFLTANHCVSTQVVASTLRIYWNYQSATCRTPGSGASGNALPRPATYSSGATLRSTYASSDFSLVQVSAAVPDSADPYYSGWDRRNQTAASAIGIHHPSGHEKRIASTTQALTITNYLNNTVTASGTHLRVIQWYQGTTEGGSSGSALFSPQKLIIGQLHGGYASCSSNTSDWYGRISTSWEGGGSTASRLRDWLDPANTGTTTFQGYRGGNDRIFAHGFEN